MRRSSCRLRIFEVSREASARDRALRIVDALAARRPVGGEGPWTVTDRAADSSQAFARAAEDLGAIDPGWVEVIDFVAIRPPSAAPARARGGRD